MTKSRLTTGSGRSLALATILLLATTSGRGQTTVQDSAVRDALAAVFAIGVEQIRDAALAAPNDALPAEISNAFAGHVPERLLRKIRWRVDDSAVSVQRGVFLLGDTRALTADYVILFANAEDASSMVLWAHELHHVVQYDEWGIDGFVTRYLDDYESIEHEANEFVWRWRDATRQNDGIACTKNVRPCTTLQH